MYLIKFKFRWKHYIKLINYLKLEFYLFIVKYGYQKLKMFLFRRWYLKLDNTNILKEKSDNKKFKEVNKKFELNIKT